jgi:hypothetical protein
VTNENASAAPREEGKSLEFYVLDNKKKGLCF